MGRVTLSPFKISKSAPVLHGVAVAAIAVSAVLNGGLFILGDFSDLYARWLTTTQPLVDWLAPFFPNVDQTSQFFQSNERLMQAQPLLVPGLRNALVLNFVTFSALLAAAFVAAPIDFFRRRVLIFESVTSLLSSSGRNLGFFLISNAIFWIGLETVIYFGSFGGHWRSIEPWNLFAFFCTFGVGMAALCMTATVFLAYLQSKLSGGDEHSRTGKRG